MDTARSTHASALLFVSTATLAAQTIAQPDWKKVEDDTLRHDQALIRFDTSATERAEAEYAKRVLDENGVPAKILVKDPERPNVVARLKGPAPEAAACPARSRRHPAGRIGRGRGVELGIGYMIAAHYPEIDAEYCIAEGGDTIREGGEARYATVQVTEKTPRGIELTAHGISGHGSVPLASNAIAHLGSAVGRFAAWQPDIRINETTGTYFQRLASVARPEQAKYYRDVISPDPQVARAATDWLFEHEPHHASMVRTSVSPNIMTGGYRSNVIPSDAKARLDVRMVPEDDPAALLEQIKRAIDDPAVDVQFAGGAGGATVPASRTDSELFKAVEAAVTAVYKVPTVPRMSTYATDMRGLRARGVQCVGIGSAIDIEDQARGFGMHSDQERLLESELHRFARLNWEIVTALAGSQ